MTEKPKEEKKLKCGLVMPISATTVYSAEHWLEIKQIIIESLEDTKFNVELVSVSDESGIIQQRIVNNLYSSEIVVCDVSGKNPNVMFELGMRLAFDKPTIIIKDDQTNYTFDTAPIEHLEYPHDLHYQKIVKFKEDLKRKVLATHEASKRIDYTTFLKNFGEFRVAKIENKEVSSEEFLNKKLEDIVLGMSILNGKINNIASNFEPKDPPSYFGMLGQDSRVNVDPASTAAIAAAHSARSFAEALAAKTKSKS